MVKYLSNTFLKKNYYKTEYIETITNNQVGLLKLQYVPLPVVFSLVHHTQDYELLPSLKFSTFIGSTK
jgi:hypothetical protein